MVDVNCEYTGDDLISDLMHDFREQNPDDMLINAKTAGALSMNAPAFIRFQSV